MAKQQIVLPADLYDTIEFAALAFGGIGAGDDWDRATVDESGEYCPRCVHGLTIAAAGGQSGMPARYSVDTDLNDQLYEAGISRVANDIAVEAINRRRGGRPTDARVTFRAWAKELNVVRGD